MLHHELNQQYGILIMEPGGALEAADFTAVAKEIDPYIKTAGHLSGVMIHAAAFPGWDSLGAFIAHLQFVRDHHQSIDKVAIVTDSEVLSIAPRLAAHFIKAEVRHFDYQDKDAALAWLKVSS